MSAKADLRRSLQAARHAMSDGDRERAGRRLAERGLIWAASLPAAGSGRGRNEDTGGPRRGGRPPSPRPPGMVAAYLSGASEPPTSALLVALVEHGYEVLVPVCRAGFRLQWVRWVPGIGLVRSPWAPVDEPVGKRLPLSVMDQVSGILLPALAVDLEGTRLGKGGGYYDRFLASLAGLQHRPATAAVVFDHELLPAGQIPADELDAPVNGVLTPDRYLDTARARH